MKYFDYGGFVSICHEFSRVIYKDETPELENFGQCGSFIPGQLCGFLTQVK